MLKEISAQELLRWQQEGRLHQLIDVREPEERELYHIGGELMPLSALHKHTCMLNPNVPIVVYCKRGMRSQIAIQRWQAVLPEAEFYNLRGGIGTHPADSDG